MKNLFIALCLALVFLFSPKLNAQVAINTEGASPNASAMLDVSSNISGVLIPRMSATQRDDIESPETGLLVFINDDNRFYVYNGSSWESILSGNDGGWIVSGNDLIASVTGNVGIGNSTPDGKLLVTNGNDTLLGVMNDKIKTNTAGFELLNSTSKDPTNFSNGLFRPAPNTVAIVTGFQERLRINSEGKIGIGITNPLGDLDLATAGSGLYENTNFRLILYSDGGSAMPRLSFIRSHSPVLGDETSAAALTLDGDVLGRMTFNGMRVNGGGASSSGAGWFEMIQKGSELTGIPGQFQIITSNGLGNRATRLVVSPEGNIGIGTENPVSKLDIEGDIDLNNNEIKNFRIENRTSDPSSPAVGQIWLRTDL